MKIIRTITAIGGSTGITLPTDLLIFLELEKGNNVEIEDKTEEDGTPYIIIKKIK